MLIPADTRQQEVPGSPQEASGAPRTFQHTALDLLAPPRPAGVPGTVCLELCSGAGGMSLGLERSGFKVTGLEREASAAAIAAAAGHQVFNADAGTYPFTGMSLDLLAGGVPCQAFSTAGKRLGAKDERNGWPWAFRAIREASPRWCLFENVPGLLQHSAKAGCRAGSLPRPLDCPGCYFAEVIIPTLAMYYPVVEFRVLDAADFGVPQRRRRVFVVAGPRAIQWPVGEYTQAALIWAKWRSGSYWREHSMEPVGEPSKEEARVLRGLTDEPDGKRWRTIRDALGLHEWATETNTNGKLCGVPRWPDEPSLTPVAGGKALGGLLACEPPVLTVHTQRCTERNPGDERPIGVDEPIFALGGGNQILEGHVQEGRGLLPQWSRPMDADQPSDTVQGAGEGPRPPFVYTHVRTEQIIACSSSVDLPAPTQQKAANTYVYEGDPEVCTRKNMVLGEQVEHRQKHPDVPVDEPANTLRSAGAGHDSPHMWLKVVDGGANPHLPGKAHERTERDLTGEPATTVAAVDVGNGGLWALASVEFTYPPGLGRSASEPERLDEPAPSVTVQEEKGTRASQSSNFDMHGGPDRASDAAFLATGRRRLTVDEVAVLQGFPPDYPWRATPTKTAQYRAVGNACPPALAEAVGRAIRKADVYGGQK